VAPSSAQHELFDGRPPHLIRSTPDQDATAVYKTVVVDVAGNCLSSVEAPPAMHSALSETNSTLLLLLLMTTISDL